MWRSEKRLLELQLDLKLSREEGESLRREVDDRRSSEVKLKEQVRSTENALRESETARTAVSDDLSKQNETLQATQAELQRLTEISESKASELNESLNRQDMLESAREAAEYEVQTMSKRYEETKGRDFEKTRDELGEPRRGVQADKEKSTRQTSRNMVKKRMSLRPSTVVHSKSCVNRSKVWKRSSQHVMHNLMD